MPDPERPEPERPAPAEPEPAPDATVRLPAGPPLDPRSTQKLPVGAPAPGETQRISRAALDEVQAQARKLTLPSPDDQPIRAQKISLPAEAEGQTEPPPAESQPRSGGWKVPLGLVVLVLLGFGAYVLLSRSGAPQAAVPAAPEAVPPDAQAYFEQAKAGDAHAMRMLGVMYYYGLNVPQDREKGLYWYRRAAERGSDAARAELEKLGVAAK